MIRHAFRLCAAVAIAATVLLFPNTAQAASPPPEGCWGQYLANPVYGGLEHCTDLVDGWGNPGLYSELTGYWNPSETWLPISRDPNPEVTNNGQPKWFFLKVYAIDGPFGCFDGYAALDSAYGPVVFGTHTGFDGKGRWGALNLITDQFYPSSDAWTARYPCF
ncbi:MAG TPA: hypothetical protein VF062_11745 [Candidatus Limnocylindrales bacterium]